MTKACYDRYTTCNLPQHYTVSASCDRRVSEILVSLKGIVLEKEYFFFVQQSNSDR